MEPHTRMKEECLFCDKYTVSMIQFPKSVVYCGDTSFLNSRNKIVSMNIMAYETMKNYEIWACPFYSKNAINMIHFPKSVSVKRSRTGSLN